MGTTNRYRQVFLGIFITAIIVSLLFLTRSVTYAQDARPGDRSGDGAAKPASSLSHSGSSPFDPPKHNDTTFVVDSSPGLDTVCSFRSDGPLIFQIQVDRVIGDMNKLRANGLLGATANLRMPAFDVDFNGGGSGVNPERDRVFFNGHIVPSEFLQGQDNTWILNDFNIPIDWVNFPDDPGDGNTLTPTANTIQIDIDTANTGEYWCTAIDWATLNIQVARPILMVHGIFSSGGTWNQAGYFQWAPALNNLGILSATLDMGALDSIGNNAGKIANRVDHLKQQWGIDRLNIVAHSKGGLDSRSYAEANPTVEKLIQLGTPNAGSPLADAAQAGTVYLFGVVATAIIDGLAAPAAIQLTTPYMQTYNLFHGPNPKTTYVSLAGDYHFGGLGIVDALVQGFYGGGNDTIVPVSSVHALSYATHLSYPSTGSTISARHTELTRSDSVYNMVLPFFKTLGQPTQSMRAAAAAGQSATTSEQTHTIADTISQGQTKPHTFFVDTMQSVNFMLQHGTGDLNLVLISPSGRRIDPTVAASSSDIEFEANNNSQGLLFEIYGLQNPEVGQWTLEVSGASVINSAGEEPYVVTATFTNSPIQMQATLNKSSYHKNEPIIIQATLSNSGAPLLGASVTTKIVLPDESVTLITLSDDGTGSDATAGDGIYTGSFENTTQAGQYRLLASAQKSASPAFNRDELLLAFVSASNSAFNGTFSDVGNDTDGDGLFEELMVNVGINVSDPAIYRVIGELADSNGALITTASAETNLNAGSQTIALHFDGDQIFQHGVNGPYFLKVIRLAENDQSNVLPLDERLNAYITTNYSYTQFRGAHIVIPETGSDQGVDTDGNGLFNRLDINLDVIVAQAGFYQWSARLVDSQGTELGVFANSGSLNAGNNTITFNFDGTPIGNNGVDGPYFLRDLLIFAGSDSAVVFQAYTTSTYHANQFEGFTVIVPPVVTIDRNGTNIDLTWSANPANATYEVHRSTTPFFTPSAATLLTTLAAGSTSYTDVGAAGDPVVNHFYIVRALAGSQHADSNEVGEIDYALNNSGGQYSLIALPFPSTTINNAATLASALGNVSTMLKWNAATKSFRIYIPPTNAGDNFPVSTGDAIFVLVNSGGPSVFSQVGNVTAVQYPLTPDGYNFIALPLQRADLTNASGVAAAITHGTTMLAWNPATQAFRIYIPPTNSGDNFAVQPGAPFIIQLDASAPTLWP